MATLVLGTIGRAAGGPVGGLFGAFLGATLDRAVLGGRGREVGRLANLAVQSSAYGEPIPLLFGTMRVAGNLVWTAGIAEASAAAGGGKAGSGSTTSYTYSASFAVLLSARRVAGVGRVWADGKLIRDGDGAWLTPITMRLHDGGDGQDPDPLIAAAEGTDGTPAYRGLAYAVFEDLPLADYGNRIPNLTFELIADGDGTDAGAVVDGLCAGRPADVVVTGSFPGIHGFAAARAGGIRDQLGALTALYDLRYVDDGSRLCVATGAQGTPVIVADEELGSVAGDAAGEGRGEVRAAAGQVDDAVAIGFHDPARDYQPGLQRVSRRADARRVTQVDIAAAFEASAAKTLAGAVLARRVAARTSATLQLPPKRLDIRPGAVVGRAGDLASWTVRRWTFAGFVSELGVERRVAGPPAVAVADAGRVHDAGDAAPGETVLQVIDRPGLFGETTPRLWVAATGTAGWRRCGVALSRDGGDSYADVGEVRAASAIGTLASTLPATSGDGWDRLNTVDIALVGDAWLEGRSEAAVLAGANLAVIGDEVAQFAGVAALGPCRFRLSTLLRGRRGTTVADHAAGSRFVFLDAGRLLAVDLIGETVGGALRLRPTGAGDLDAVPVDVVLADNRPSPLRCGADAGVADRRDDKECAARFCDLESGTVCTAAVRRDGGSPAAGVRPGEPPETIDARRTVAEPTGGTTGDTPASVTFTASASLQRFQGVIVK